METMEAEPRSGIEHSESLESRDNPFLPGGELSKEAEDLLSRATIIRDNFYLNEEEKRVLLEQQRQDLQQQQELQQQQNQQKKKGGKHVQIVDHNDGGDLTSVSRDSHQHPVEERMCVAASTSGVSATPTTPPAPPTTTSNGDGGAHLENGGRTGSPLSSADVVVKVPGSTDGEVQSTVILTDGVVSPNSHPDGLNVADSDKKKPRNKCCSIM